MKYKHIIWDWNGTLVDDTWLFVDIMNGVLKNRKLNGITLDDYRNVFDFPVQDYYQKLGFDFNVEPYDIPSMEFVALYNKNKYRPNLYDGATDLLRMIKNQGLRFSVFRESSRSYPFQPCHRFGAESSLIPYNRVRTTVQFEFSFTPNRSNSAGQKSNWSRGLGREPQRRRRTKCVSGVQGAKPPGFF